MKLMRRIDKQLSNSMAEAILVQNHYGILSIVLPDGTPYGVPVNYGYVDHEIIIHGATEGTKIDAIRINPFACFTVVHAVINDFIHLNTKYTSTIVHGNIKIITNPEEKRMYLIKLVSHYGLTERDIKTNLITETDITAVLVMSIDQITAKGQADFVQL
ncbi:MAG: pyridoxamine 5'-phosphate oxidase family protein [Candidatus Izemoplasmatales bacterium]|nr:pyridoxamine 5'-phosphate oxidase family protein [Candidatus Izemoplasmatales bacterium]MDD4595556.1 pyridoxamine 5'-phosphate oxidase family protein [Candidatus Izemoplasmatales bacterium]